MKFLTRRILPLLTALVFIISVPSAVASQQSIEPTDVIVGLSVRPPFLGALEKSGAGPDILKVLNTIQTEYNFLFKVIPSSRKTQAIKENWVDIVMWDNLSWGWENTLMQASISLVSSKDIYIALVEDNRTNDFFDDLSNRKLSFVSSYHYKITNFETNEDELSKRFDFYMVRTEEAAIRMVLSKRVEATITSETALSWFLIRYPQYMPQILISKHFDTQYSRHFLVPKDGAINIEDINLLLKLADEKGLLAPIYKKYGLEMPKF
jgi:ABC-type amino acid transport substrate-binding protein